MDDTRDERGETLLEVLVSLVVIGLVIGGLFANYATSATASKSPRDFVTADALLRSRAEATKQAVRRDCASSATYTTTTTSLPANFNVAVSPSTTSCPGVTTVQPLVITATLPNGHTKTLSVEVRSP